MKKKKSADLGRNKLAGILKKHPSEKGRAVLMPLLQDVQQECGYLSQDVLESVGRYLDVPLSHIYGVVTFYAQFSLVPRGRNIIKVCAGTACHIKGAGEVLEAIRSALKITESGVSPDFKFSLEIVRCLGTCFLAPVVMINDDYYGDLSPAKIKKILVEY